MTVLTIFKKILKQNIFLITGGATALLLSLSTFEVIGLVFSFIVLAASFSFAGVFSTLINRLLLSFLIGTTLHQIAGIIFWVLDRNLTTFWCTTIILIASLLFTALQNNHNKRHALGSIATKSDIIALLITVASIAFIICGNLLGGPLAQQLLRFTTTGFDNAAHISLIRTTYDEQGYVYGNHEEVIDRVLHKSLVSYPQGWHLSSSIFWRAVQPNGISSIKTTLVMYFSILLLWYAAAIYLFLRISLSVYSILSNKNEKYDSVVLIILASFALLAQILIFYSLLKSGFGNFLSQIAYILALALLILDTNDIKEKLKGNLDFEIRFIIGLTICAAMSLSWLLAAPIGFIMLALMTVINKGTISNTFRWILSKPLISLYAVLVLSIPIFQSLIQILFTEKANYINQEGGIMAFNGAVMAVSLALCLYAFWSLRPKYSTAFIAITAGSFMMSGLVYALQFITGSRATYFSYKVAYLPYVLLLTLAVGILVFICMRMIAKHGVFVPIIFTLSLAMFIPQMLGIDLRPLNFASGEYRLVSPYTSSQILGLLNKEGGNQASIVTLKELDYEEDVIASQFVNLLSRRILGCEEEIIWLRMSNQRDALISKIGECAETRGVKYYVISSTKNYEELTDKFSAKNVEVILSN